MKLLRSTYIISTIAFTMLLASCKIQKDYVVPNLPDDDTFKNQFADSTSFANTKWWDFFNDKTLKLMAKVFDTAFKNQFFQNYGIRKTNCLHQKKSCFQNIKKKFRP